MDNLGEVLRQLREAGGFISGDHIAGKTGRFEDCRLEVHEPA